MHNRPEDIAACLHSLTQVDYPAEKLEIIVVDDGSTDQTADAAREYGVKVISQARSLGAAASRNRGAEIAGGEFLAFLDSDCLVSSSWLREIIPWFTLPGIGAVGGFVAGYYQKTGLDRYEAAFSSLNMGRRIIYHAGGED